MLYVVIVLSDLLFTMKYLQNTAPLHTTGVSLDGKFLLYFTTLYLSILSLEHGAERVEIRDILKKIGSKSE
jgi:hypothetical protein